ncbi:MAG: DUF2155 domain-containing protein [Alphaproteobacteria bacterium]
MNRLILLTLLPASCLLLPASTHAANWLNFSGEPSPTAPAADGSGATLRLLDKNTNRLKDIPLKAGATSTGTVAITLRRCVADVQGIPGQDVAWVDVVETADTKPLYSGWMFNLYPDVATLENPRYDVRLIGCTRPDGTTKPKASTSATAPKVVEESMAPTDSEAPDSEAAPTEADPNYIPGVEKANPPATEDPLHNLMDNPEALPERPTTE